MTMSPLRDEELIRDPDIRRAVEMHHGAASTPTQVRSRRWPIRWLMVATIGMLVIVIIGIIRLAG
jgi:hypothetical protein